MNEATDYTDLHGYTDYTDTSTLRDQAEHVAERDSGGKEEGERDERRAERHLRGTAAEVPVALVLVIRDEERARRGEQAEQGAEDGAELQVHAAIVYQGS